MSTRVRLIEALDASMDALQLADDANDEDAAWQEIQHVLSGLHRLEEQDRQSNDLAYYRHRDSSTQGRIAGGLSWLRGLMLHHEADVRLRLFRPFAITGEDTAPQPLAYQATPGGGSIFVDDVLWPVRQQLPAPGRRFRAHQRDEYYDQLIAGKPLMQPLRAARNYFVDERAFGNGVVLLR